MLGGRACVRISRLVGVLVCRVFVCGLVRAWFCGGLVTRLVSLVGRFLRFVCRLVMSSVGLGCCILFGLESLGRDIGRVRLGRQFGLGRCLGFGVLGILAVLLLVL